MDYIRLTIGTTGEGIEAVVGALSAIDIDQVEIIQDLASVQRHLESIAAEWDFADPQEIMRGMGPAVRVFIPIEEDKDAQGRAVSQVYERMDWLREQDFGLDVGALAIESEIIREEDWANNWKKYYKPMRIGKNFIIKPSWEEYHPQRGDKVIEIDPGMAFGTGSHETTALCLEALEEVVRVGDSVLDIGCGSGVLAIACALCGARTIEAIDIDPIAVKVAQENVARNDLISMITCRRSDLLEGGAMRANVVIANIVADVVLRLFPAAFEHTIPGGVTIVSGIVDVREIDVIRGGLEAGFFLHSTLQKGVWRAMVFRRMA